MALDLKGVTVKGIDGYEFEKFETELIINMTNERWIIF